MKINRWSRLLALILAAVLVLAAFAGCKPTTKPEEGDAPDDVSEIPTETYVIGVAEAQANDDVATRRAYYENFIAPNYNVKFIFSETLADDAAVKTFIENCIDSGADAIIDFKSGSPVFAQLCQDNGIVYTSNQSLDMYPEYETTIYDTFVGIVGGSIEQIAELYADWLAENASETGEEGFIIASVLASQGNTQHHDCTVALLEALQAKYDLTFEDTIENIAIAPNTQDVPNDKGILITIYPGASSKDTWLPGISTLIQSGRYSMILSCAQSYNQSATVINEVEQSTGKNIVVASLGVFGDPLTTAFNTKDPFGNSSVDLVLAKYGTILNAALFAQTYNALTADITTTCLTDGGPSEMTANIWIPVTSAEQLDTMKGWDDRDAGNWVAGSTFVDSLLAVKNPGMTSADFQAALVAYDYDAILAVMTGNN